MSATPSSPAGEGAAPVALVTGASRGLGRATAVRLAADGHDVVVNYCRNAELADEVVREVEALGRRALAVRADLEATEQIDAMFATVGERFGRLDVLIANAAASSFKPLLALTENNVNRTLRLTVHGFIGCVQRAVPLMEGRPGRIVAISGVDACHYMPGHGLLGAAKAAMESLVRAFAIELGPLGITVNAVRPGGFETDSSRIYGGSEFAFLREQLIRQSGVKDFGTVDDIAASVAFLVRGEARYVTGHTIVVDGGVSANLADLDAINHSTRVLTSGRVTT